MSMQMCAPYNALQNYKLKVKMTPGSQRKGRAARQVDPHLYLLILEFLSSFQLNPCTMPFGCPWAADCPEMKLINLRHQCECSGWCHIACSCLYRVYCTMQTLMLRCTPNKELAAHDANTQDITGSVKMTTGCACNSRGCVQCYCCNWHTGADQCQKL